MLLHQTHLQIVTSVITRFTGESPKDNVVVYVTDGGQTTAWRTESKSSKDSGELSEREQGAKESSRAAADSAKDDGLLFHKHFRCNDLAEKARRRN